MKFFKKETLTHGIFGGFEGAFVGGAVAALGVASVPAITAVAVAGTVLGALHGADDEGGKCRKVVNGVEKVARWGASGVRSFMLLGGGGVIEIIKNGIKEFVRDRAVS